MLKKFRIITVPRLRYGKLPGPLGDRALGRVKYLKMLLKNMELIWRRRKRTKERKRER